VRTLCRQGWGAASQACGRVRRPADAAVQQQPQPVVGEVAEAMPDALDLLTSRFTASAGPLEQPLVAWKARISASQALTVRASRDSSGTWTPSAQWSGLRRSVVMSG
jgi:hypothetical protein